MKTCPAACARSAARKRAKRHEDTETREKHQESSAAAIEHWACRLLQSRPRRLLRAALQLPFISCGFRFRRSRDCALILSER